MSLATASTMLSTRLLHHAVMASSMVNRGHFHNNRPRYHYGHSFVQPHRFITTQTTTDSKTKDPISAVTPNSIFKPENHAVQQKERVFLDWSSLKSGYDAVGNRMHELITRVCITAAISPALAGAWVYFTGEGLASPVAVAVLATGAIVIGQHFFQYLRMKKYARLSVLTDLDGPAIDASLNEKVKQIIFSPDPKVKFNLAGLNILGIPKPIQDYKPSEKTLQEIKSLKRVVIPTDIMNYDAGKQVGEVWDRWMTRITVPFSILNIAAITAKMADKDQHMLPSDYIALAASFKNLKDFIYNSGLGEERDNFRNLLLKGKSPSQVAEILMTSNALNGEMNFLKYWLEKPTVGVRIDRGSSVVLYQNREHSLMGPYPIHHFPKKVHHDE